MAIVRKSNRVLQIKDDAVELYLSKGYEVIDEAGEVLVESTPMDLDSYKIAYAKQKDELDELKKKYDSLLLKLEKKQSKKQ